MDFGVTACRSYVFFAISLGKKFNHGLFFQTFERFGFVCCLILFDGCFSKGGGPVGCWCPEN